MNEVEKMTVANSSDIQNLKENFVSIKKSIEKSVESLETTIKTLFRESDTRQKEENKRIHQHIKSGDDKTLAKIDEVAKRLETRDKELEWVLFISRNPKKAVVFAVGAYALAVSDFREVVLRVVKSFL